MLFGNVYPPDEALRLGLVHRMVPGHDLMRIALDWARQLAKQPPKALAMIKRAVYEGLTRYQKVNHFPFSYYITRKDLMYRAVSRMKEIHGAKHFGFVPKTYILPQEYLYLEDELRANPAKMWIIKPHASS